MRSLVPLLLLVLSGGCFRLNQADYDDARDQDGDGIVDDTYGGPDCDPSDPAINPEADEVCDGIDNDCDGETDEATAVDASTWYADGDGDGYGDPDNDRIACEQPSGFIPDAGDCDDSDAMVTPELAWYPDSDGDGYGDRQSGATVQCEQPADHVLDNTDCDDDAVDVNPGETELCDEVDHDCDGNDGYDDIDGDGFIECMGDCDDDNAAVNPGADESCNGLDDDCDDEVDEDDAVDAPTWYLDGDSDSYGEAASSLTQCDQPTGYVAIDGDCDDADPNQFPGADEYCNGEDDDCDDEVDEPDAVDASTWFADADTDGYGDSGVSALACDQPSGHVDDDGDCDDADPDQFPGADEYCNGEDDDCDRSVDEGDAVDVLTWYLDYDSDGFGDASSTTTSCAAPKGYVADDTDCSDEDAAVNPDADEICNGVDDDCDGDTDEDDSLDATTWYLDGDSDGYGDPGIDRVACTQPAGHVDNDQDCDDSDAGLNPETTWYPDEDLDGYGLDDDAVNQCEPLSEHSLDNTDCDDLDAGINPGATERCDGVDNDCDGTIDYEHNVDGVSYSSIQDALNSASGGERVCVRANHYTETIWLEGDILLEGEDRDNTTIDADGSFPAVTLYDVGPGYGIRGFTLTGATGDQGVAITSTLSDAVVADLLIEDNHAVHGGQCVGALITYHGGASAMENVEIRNNTAECDQIWGQLWLGSGSLAISHLLFSGNLAWATGESYAGLMVSSGSALDITNAIISGNTVEPAVSAVQLRSGVLANTGGTLTVTNATIHGNSVDVGTGYADAGLLYDSGGATTLLNLSVSDNIVTGSYGASIGWGGNPISYSNIWAQDTPYFSFSTLPGSVTEADPEYTDDSSTDAWEWALTYPSSSALHDKGDPTMNDADGSRADIGAHGGPGSDGW
jgi:hypothetical protein